MEKVVNLPVAIGMNEKHFSLKDDFLSRLRGMISRDGLELKNYQMAEDYLGNAQEILYLETDEFRLRIEMTAKKA